MKGKKFRQLIMISIMGFFLLFTGCGDDDDDDFFYDEEENTSSVNGECNCDSSPIIDENGLILLFEKQNVKKPSNVSILMKIETESGAPVSNLTADDFSIFEDGRLISKFESKQAIVPSPEDFTYYTLLILDLSGSVLESESLPDLKDAAEGFVEAIMPNPDFNTFGSILMGIRWFDGSDELHSLKPFITDTKELISGINSIKENISKDTSTNLYGAVIEGIKIMNEIVEKNKDTVSVGGIVIFTDGRDQAGRKTFDEALDAVEDTDDSIAIYTIGLGGEIDEDVLKSLGKNGFTLAGSFEELVPKFQLIASQINKDANSHYFLEYCSPKRKGEHDLKIEVKDGKKSGSLTTCFCADGFEGGCKVSGGE